MMRWETFFRYFFESSVGGGGLDVFSKNEHGRLWEEVFMKVNTLFHTFISPSAGDDVRNSSWFSVDVWGYIKF